MEKILFTSESVSEGHPDKIADQISDAVLDACLEQDKFSKVACEVFTTTKLVVVGGEIKSNAKINIETIVRNKLRQIGYTDEKLGIDCDTCTVQNVIHEQSIDINQGVISSYDKNDIGAGDQGIMFGYATDETKNFMPLAITIANDLCYYASKLRKEGLFKYSRPDMKSQVTIDYTNNPKIDTVLFSIQHDEDYDEVSFKKFIKEEIVDKVLKDYQMELNYRLLINPTGRFVTGGPHGDSGLTGRKIIVDTYGGASRHGGGAFSGKDATKVDRSGAYMARYIAKNIVGANLCERCEIQLSYAIGVSAPTSILVEAFGTNKCSITTLTKAVRDIFDLTPSGIIKQLDLLKPIYGDTSIYGHFTNSKYSWEQLNRVDELINYIEKNDF